jgi:hypothetical protein
MNPDGTPREESFVDSVNAMNKPDQFLDEMSLTQLLKIASILLIANIAVYKYRY